MTGNEALTLGMGAIINAAEGKGVIVVGLPGKAGGFGFGFSPIFVSAEMMETGDVDVIGLQLGLEVVALWRKMREQEANRPRIIRPKGGPVGLNENGEIVQ